MELARYLIEQASENFNEPIPFLFPLASWSNQKIEDWLTVELSRYAITKKQARKLLREQKLLLLLDGLDELEPLLQVSCLRAINHFLEDNQYGPQRLVVSCRLDEYRRCALPLKLNGSVCLQPLTEQQVEDHLKQVGRQEFLEKIRSDTSLLKVAQTPVFLFMIETSLRDQETSLENIGQDISEKEWHQYLFDFYIQYSLNPERISGVWHHKRKPSSDKTFFWLSWLAKKLKESSQTEFLIEKIQPTWLETSFQRWFYRFIVAIFVSITISPICSLIGILVVILNKHGINDVITSSVHLNNYFRLDDNNIKVGLFIGILLSILLGIFVGFLKEIKPVETIKSPKNELINILRTVGLRERVIGAFINNFRMPYEMRNSFPVLLDWTNLLAGSIVGFFLPLSVPFRGLISGLRGPDLDIKHRAFPNQGIYKSAKNSILLAVIFGVTGVMIGFIFSLINRSSASIGAITFVDVNYSLLGGLVGSLVGGLSAGMACIQHLALRLVLFWSNLAPLDYVHFLNYATDRLLLQRIGGRYRFIHDMLREHFSEHNGGIGRFKRH